MKSLIYLHAKFVEQCLREKVNVPTQLAINEGMIEGKRSEGFQKTRNNLINSRGRSVFTHLDRTCFCHKTNYTLFLNCPPEETPGDESDAMNHLKKVEGYFKEVSREWVQANILLIALTKGWTATFTTKRSR